MGTRPPPTALGSPAKNPASAQVHGSSPSLAAPPLSPREPPPPRSPPAGPLQSTHRGARPRGPQRLGRHGPSTWGPPRPRDGISLSLATTNTVPRQPASSLCLLLSPWRPQCHRGGSLAKATTITQHRPDHSSLHVATTNTAAVTVKPLLSKAATSPSLDGAAPACWPACLPACGLLLSDCSPCRLQNPRRWIRPGIDSAPRFSAPGSLQAPRSAPLDSGKAPPPEGEEETTFSYPWKLAPSPALAQIPLPCQGAGGPGLASQLGEGAGVGLPPTLHGGPVPAPPKACGSTSCLPGPVEGKLGRGGWGCPQPGAGAGQGRRRQTGDRPDHITVGDAGSPAPCSHTAALEHSQKDPVLTDVCGQRGPLRPARLYPWPGLREVPTAAVATAAVATESRVPGPGPGDSSFSPGSSPSARGSEGEKGEGGRGEEERRRGRGAAGGREEGKC